MYFTIIVCIEVNMTWRQHKARENSDYIESSYRKWGSSHKESYPTRGLDMEEDGGVYCLCT